MEKLIFLQEKERLRNHTLTSLKQIFEASKYILALSNGRLKITFLDINIRFRLKLNFMHTISGGIYLVMFDKHVLCNLRFRSMV